MNQRIDLEFYATSKEDVIEEININDLKQKKAPQMHVGHILLRFYFNKKTKIKALKLKLTTASPAAHTMSIHSHMITHAAMAHHGDSCFS